MPTGNPTSMWFMFNVVNEFQIINFFVRGGGGIYSYLSFLGKFQVFKKRKEKEVALRFGGVV